MKSIIRLLFLVLMTSCKQDIKEEISIETDVSVLASDAYEGRETGTNVLVYIDNQANNTIIIGSHYDHLGYGGEGSLYR